MKSFTSVLAAGLGVAGATGSSQSMDLEEAHRHIRENVAGIQQTYGSGAGQGLCDKYTCCE
jgi:hypothetical protein